MYQTETPQHCLLVSFLSHTFLAVLRYDLRVRLPTEQAEMLALLVNMRLNLQRHGSVQSHSTRGAEGVRRETKKRRRTRRREG